jgi:hypothetical protein
MISDAQSSQVWVLIVETFSFCLPLFTQKKNPKQTFLRLQTLT